MAIVESRHIQNALSRHSKEPWWCACVLKVQNTQCTNVHVLCSLNVHQNTLMDINAYVLKENN